jgi:TniQ
LTAHICLPISTAVRSPSATWSWLIPLGFSRRSSPPVGFQVCPSCLSSGEPYFRWQSRVALFFRCTEHGCLLINRCPACEAGIHPYAFGLRHACAGIDGKLDRCDQCSFDLRGASPSSGRASGRKTQAVLGLRLASTHSVMGKPKGEYFVVLRHLVDLLAGESAGLEDLRAVVALHSGVPRLDVGPSYDPDLDIPSFEEMAVEAKELILEAALWLIDKWPKRFLKCCQEAGLRSSVLNRGAVSVDWYNKAVTSAY